MAGVAGGRSGGWGAGHAFRDLLGPAAFCPAVGPLLFAVPALAEARASAHCPRWCGLAEIDESSLTGEIKPRLKSTKALLAE